MRTHSPSLGCPQTTGKVEQRAGNARPAPPDHSGINPHHPLDGPRRRTHPSSCISRFDFCELELLLFHGACTRARARVGGGLVHDVKARLSPRGLHVLHPGSCDGDGAAGSVRSPSCARRARPAFAIFSRTPRVFYRRARTKLGPVGGCMDKPLATPRCAYCLVWLLRPPSRRVAGV